MTAQWTYSFMRLAGFYFLYFMSLGISLPFFPGYFHALGFSATHIGLLLAVAPCCALIAPPLWGYLADRTGRPGMVLCAVCAGAALGYLLLTAASTLFLAFLALVLHATFASSITSLIDALALQHVFRAGGSYARLRVFGSLGFVIAALSFGLVVHEYGLATVLWPLVLMTSAALWVALFLARTPRVTHSGPRPSLHAVGALLRRPEVAWFLVATAMHWIACTPYHGNLALYVMDLQYSPTVVSLSVGVAIVSEIIVMWTWQRWVHIASSQVLLLLAFAASGVRWALMAWIQHPMALVAIASMHAFSFGLFYLAAVAWMTERTPASLRATGQALFIASTFGVGGLVGFMTSGRMYDAVGGSQLFSLAAAFELLPMLALAGTLRPTRA